MRGLTTTGSEDALGDNHAGQVIRVRFTANEDALDTLGGESLGLRVVEGDLADGGTRGGGHASGDEFLGGLLVELGEHELRELVAGDASQGLVTGDELFFDELDGDTESSGCGALADAGLEHPEFAAFDRELNVAHIAVVRLELTHDAAKLVVGGLVDVLEVSQGEGVADTCDDVLALRVLQVVAVHAGVARGGVAGEADTRSRALAHVAEDHCADVDGGAEVVGDALAAAVDAGAFGVP